MDAIDNLRVVFTDALAEVISTVTSVHLQCVPADEDAGLEELTGVMSLYSKKGGTLFITAKEPSIRILCSNMTGIPEEEVTGEDIEDTLCEFVNMTAGSAKLRISDPDYIFTLSLPFIVKGKDVTIDSKRKSHVFSEVLENGEISIRLRFVC